MIATLAEGPMKSVVPLLNSFADGIARLNKVLSENPEMAGKAGTAAGAGGLALAGYGLYRAGKWMFGRGPAAPTVADALGEAGSKAGAAGGSSWARMFPWLFAAGSIATQPDILSKAPTGENWRDVIKGLPKKAGRSDLSAGLSPGYSRDFTMGSTGGFSKAPSIVPPGGFKRITDYNARNVAPGPLGQMPAELSGGIAAAGVAGQDFGASFRSGFNAEMDKAVAETREKVKQLIDALSFSARPSIQPSSGGTPGRGASLDRVKRALRGSHADYGFDTA